jgi:predicted RNase H-like HicB family nuclease
MVIEKAKHNYAAYAPDVPGCASTGKTIEEVTRNMQEALSLHLSSLKEDNEPIPEPQAIAEYVQVPETDRDALEGRSDAFEDAIAFFESHKEELLKAYEGKYVAIIDGKVVDSDEDGVALPLRVYKKYGYKAIYMPKVERERRIVHIPTPFRING